MNVSLQHGIDGSDCCKICCNRQGNRFHIAREMMFGLKHEFSYLECARCGCVQLIQIPSNIADYYPNNYYAYSAPGNFKIWLRHQWAKYSVGKWNFPGWMIGTFLWRYESLVAVHRAGISPDASILDVGCGSGYLLLDLHYLSFQNVSGLDPFIPGELAYPNGVIIRKKSLSEITGSFDVIMFHHSFEHMDNPAIVLKQVKRLLSPSGLVIIRVPVADSYAWRHYGSDWIHLDPPRHFYLHTQKSMELLAGDAALRVTQVVREGNETGLIGSEQYRANIPLHDPQSFSRPLNLLLRWKEIRQLRHRANELNKAGQGDWACFHLRNT